MVLTHTGAAALWRARAQTAADAAALAEVAEPGTAPAAAARNRARVAEVVREGDRATVRVDHPTYGLGGPGAAITAMASAEAPPVAWRGLNPVLVAALAEAERLLGEPVPIVSGFRTRAEQQALWDNRHNNPYPVARPGTSDHERGLAIDIPLSFVPRLRSVMGAVGVCQPLPDTDPVHFRLCAAMSSP
jgi:hypothetical protein